MRDRILVADDNRFAADSLARIIKIVGYDVTTTYSGNGALEQIAAFQPDLALIDIGMPDLDGFEVARRIRQQCRVPPLILVALTAWARNEDRRHAYECGFDRHVAKPISLELLRNVLAMLDQATACFSQQQ
jgi:CheY-like chemotaxis protein